MSENKTITTTPYPYQDLDESILGPRGFKKIDKSIAMEFFKIRQSINKNTLTAEDLKKCEQYHFTSTNLDTLYHQISFALQNYYYLGANPTADCIIICGDKVLMVQRSIDSVEGGKWAIPGGFVDTVTQYSYVWVAYQETPLDAAKRELMEETGINKEALDKVEVIEVGVFEGDKRDPRDNDYAWSKSHAYAFIVPPDFIAQHSTKKSIETDDVKWQLISELESLNIAFDHKKILKIALQKASLISSDYLDDCNPLKTLVKKQKPTDIKK